MGEVITWETELYQVGSFVTPEQAAVIIALLVGIFVALSWRFLRQSRRTH